MDKYSDRNKLYIAIRQLERAKLLLNDGSAESQPIIEIIDKKINRYKNMINKLSPSKEESWVQDPKE